jgi:hypothetical protein
MNEYPISIEISISKFPRSGASAFSALSAVKNLFFHILFRRRRPGHQAPGTRYLDCLEWAQPDLLRQARHKLTQRPGRCLHSLESGTGLFDYENDYDNDNE